MFRLTGFKLHNICQHADIEATVQTGLNAVVGPNGSGKTSMLRGLAYALTGLVDGGWGNQQSLQKDGGADVGYAEAYFTDGQSEYTVRRFSTSSVKFPDRLFKDGELIAERRKTVNAEMEKVFGMSCQLMFDVCWGRQGELANLLKSPPALVSAFLAQVFDTKQLEKIREKLKIQLDTILPQRDCTEQIASAEKELAELPDIRQLEHQARDAYVELKRTSDEHAKVTAALMPYAAWKDALQKAVEVELGCERAWKSHEGYTPVLVREACIDSVDAEHMLHDYQRRKDVLVQQLQMLADKQKRLQCELESCEQLEKNIKADNVAILARLSDVNADCPLCGAELKELKTDFPEKLCAFLTGRTIDSYNRYVKEQLEKVSNDLSSVRLEIGETRTSWDTAMSEFKQVNEKIDDLKVLVADGRYYEDKEAYDEAVKNRQDIEQRPHASEEQTAVQKAAAEAHDRAAAAVRDIELALATAKARKDVLEKSIKQLKQFQQTYETTEAVRKAFTAIREAMSQPRAQARYLKSRVERLNVEISRYVEMTGMPFAIRLDPDTRCFVYKTADGFEHPSVHLSGAQQAMAAVSLQMALLSVMQPNMNLYLIDEPTEALDDENKVIMAAMFGRMNRLLPAVSGTMLIVTRDEGTISSCGNVIESRRD